jgi:phosphoribosylformylglycinamidine synthase
LVRSCHDVAEGGIAVALAEMAIGGVVGVDVSLSRALRSGPVDATAALFSESLGRLLVEVEPPHCAEFEEQMAGYPTEAIGDTTKDKTIRIAADGTVISADLARLTRAWRGDTA